MVVGDLFHIDGVPTFHAPSCNKGELFMHHHATKVIWSTLVTMQQMAIDDHENNVEKK